MISVQNNYFLDVLCFVTCYIENKIGKMSLILCCLHLMLLYGVYI